MSPRGTSLALSAKVPELTDEDLASLSTEERRAEAFILHSSGWRQTDIARRFGVTQTTISNDLKVEARARRSRLENLEEETERFAGVLEETIRKAWERHEEAANSNINSVAATNYLKLVLEATDRLVRLRGLDNVRPAGNGPKGQTRVVVQIGATATSPAIAVGVES